MGDGGLFGGDDLLALLGGGGGSTDADFLAQAAAGNRPLAGVRPPAAGSGVAGLPFGDGPLGLAANIAAQSLLPPEMARAGLFPLGLGRQQNAYDLTRQRLELAEVNRAAADPRVMRAEAAGYVRLAEGVSALAGVPFGADQRELAGRLAGYGAGLSPMLARAAPQVLEAVAGPAGSAVNLALKAAEADRYRADPLTGRRGVSGAESGARSAMLYDRLFSAGDARNTSGLGALQVGELYGDLVSRGLAPAAEGLAGLDPARVAAAARRQGVAPRPDGNYSTADRDRLAADPELREDVRQVDVGRTERVLKKYSGAVGAVREIFGANGRPNAPMAELIGALEALTAGGVGRVDPKQLEATVRDTVNAATRAGVSLRDVLTLQQESVKRLVESGASPLAAPRMVQQALDFRASLVEAGAVARPNAARGDADQLSRAKMQADEQAEASTMAGSLAVLARMADTGQLPAGSELAALGRAVAAGDDRYTAPDGSSRPVAVPPKLLRGMLDAAGPGARDAFESQLADPVGRKLAVERFRTGAVASRYQAAETREMIAGPAEANAIAVQSQLLIGPDVTRDQADMIAAVMPRVLGDLMTDATPEERRLIDEDKFEQAYAGRVAAERKTNPILDRLLARVPAADQSAFVARVAGMAKTNFRRNDPNERTFEQAQALYDRRTADKTDAIGQERRLRGEMQSAGAGDGKRAFFAQLVAAVKDADPADPAAARTAMLRAFGGEAQADMARPYQAGLVALARREAGLDGEVASLSAVTDPAERKNRAADIRRRRAELNAEKDSLLGQVEALGLDKAGPLADTARAGLRAFGRAEASAQAAAATVSDEVTADQRDAVRQELAASPADAGGVARKQNLIDAAADAAKGLGLDRRARADLTTRAGRGDLTDAEADAVERARRRRVSPDPTAAEVDAAARASGGELDARAADEYARLARRADRLGLETTEPPTRAGLDALRGRVTAEADRQAGRQADAAAALLGPDAQPTSPVAGPQERLVAAKQAAAAVLDQAAKPAAAAADGGFADPASGRRFTPAELADLRRLTADGGQMLAYRRGAEDDAGRALGAAEAVAAQTTARGAGLADPLLVPAGERLAADAARLRELARQAGVSPAALLAGTADPGRPGAAAATAEARQIAARMQEAQQAVLDRVAPPPATPAALAAAGPGAAAAQAAATESRRAAEVGPLADALFAGLAPEKAGTPEARRAAAEAVGKMDLKQRADLVAADADPDASPDRFGKLADSLGVAPDTARLARAGLLDLTARQARLAASLAPASQTPADPAAAPAAPPPVAASGTPPAAGPVPAPAAPAVPPAADLPPPVTARMAAAVPPARAAGAAAGAGSDGPAGLVGPPAPAAVPAAPPPPADQGAAAGPRRLAIEGTLKIRADGTTADLSDAYLVGSGFTVPT